MKLRLGNWIGLSAIVVLVDQWTKHLVRGALLNLSESEDIAKALKKAMEAIEDYKPELAGVLPQDEYFRLTRSAQT